MRPTETDTNLNQHFANRVFSIDLRVYYEDTDAAGVVYYANYLRFMERARTEWLRAIATGAAMSGEATQVYGDVDALMHGADGRRTGFVARHVAIDYDQPARLDDLIRVDATVADATADLGGRKPVGGASVWLRQSVRLLQSGQSSGQGSSQSSGQASGESRDDSKSSTGMARDTAMRPTGSDTEPLVTALVKLGCVDFETFRPVRLPPGILNAL